MGEKWRTVDATSLRSLVRSPDEEEEARYGLQLYSLENREIFDDHIYRTRLYSIVIDRFGIRVSRSRLLCTCAGFGKVAGEFKSKWTQIRRGIFSDRVYRGNGLSLLTSRVDRRSLLTYISTDDLSPCPSDRIRHSIVNNSSLDVRANAPNVYRDRHLFRNN